MSDEQSRRHGLNVAVLKPIHRIVQFSSDGGLLQVLGSDGRMWVKMKGAWVELPSYPPGLAPTKQVAA